VYTLYCHGPKLGHDGTLVAAMQQIADWLQKLGMSEYVERFAENDIDMAVLPDLTDQHLKDLGVSLGHRLKMLRAIRDLSGAPVAVTAPSATMATEPTRRDEAERRQLTILFCDLVGSTALSAKLDPEDLRSLIATYHRCCTEVVERRGGFVAKYMGDGVLAYFGYPQAHEHDAERAVRAGLAVAEAAPKLSTAAGMPLQVRIGIATGLVVVGDLIGAGAAQEQAVVGETPNLAARLQALAEPGAVVIAASTRRLTGGLFDYRDLGTTALKGFAENVPAWQVLGASAIESRFEAMRTATTPLVGRDEEIDLLLRRWEQAKGGDGQVVLISGEPGIGKSRIAETILERVSNEPHIRLRYFCSPDHQDSALYPSVTQLERAAGFRRDDTDKQRLDRLEAVLARGTNDLSEAVPLLADLLSISTGDRYPPLNLTPQKRKEKTLHAQLAQVEGLAAQQPVLMVWEDVHWSDPTTRESLDLLIERVATLQVLVIIAFRPEFAPPWIGRPHVTMLNLNRLPPRQRADMIVHVTGGRALPKEIAKQIVDRTDGVPLFIEELTKSVIESGIVVKTGDQYVAIDPVAPLAIPTSLHASLLARLDRLAPVREVAQIAAAVGRSFSHELISAVASMEQQQVNDALDKLVSAELVFQRGITPHANYTFKHALVQDAAYSTLLRGRRQQIHARIAVVLEERFPEHVNTQPEVLAHHYTEAGLMEKAVRYWLKAGEQSTVRSAMVEAVVQLQRGLDLLVALPDSAEHRQQELDLLVVLGRALLVTRGYAAPIVGETYARARLLAEQLNQSKYLVPLLYGEGGFHLVRAEDKLALKLYANIETVGEQTNDSAVILLGHYLQGCAHCFMGDFSAARDSYNKCHTMDDAAYRAFYATLIAEDPHAGMLGQLAVMLSYLGFFEQARARIKQALSEARQLASPYTLAYVLHMAGWIEWIANSPETVQQYARSQAALCSEHDFALFAAWAQLYNGWSLTALGRPEEGFHLLANVLPAYRASGSVVGLPIALTFLAEAYSKLGRPMEALQRIAEAEHIVATSDERYSEAELHRLRGDLVSSTSDPTAAEGSYRRALSVAKGQSAKTMELRAATSLACLWRDQGKRAEARNLLAPIYGWFTEGFDTPVLQEAKALLDQLV
jgi:class 3 adenylate cyclase/tetratricopeptide (TPR) repeat protein